MRRFDSSIEVSEACPFWFAHPLRRTGIYPLLATDQRMNSVSELAGDGRCRQ